jgi:uncharacterized protein YndB with AHSA1/START domain
VAWKNLVVMSTFALTPAALAGGGERTMKHQVDVDATVGQLWAAWTTKRGIESWMVPVAEIDLRVGGTLRTHYDPKARIGDPGTITQRILSYHRGRMLSFRTERSPEGFPHAKAIEATWCVVYFKRLDAKRTRVTFVSCGWGRGGHWDDAWEFFQRGNAQTLEVLRRRFPPPPRGDAG